MYRASIALTLASSLAFATPALADPTIGVGFSIGFGGGTTQTGVGFRIFSNDEQDSFAATVGLDYLFNDGSWRGTLGGAYLGTDSYVGLDLGVGLGGGNFDFGAGVGFVNTTAPTAPAAAPPPPAGGGVVRN
jgi:hypothetical protein